jgi:hypothetical protein
MRLSISGEICFVVGAAYMFVAHSGPFLAPLELGFVAVLPIVDL